MRLRKFIAAGVVCLACSSNLAAAQDVALPDGPGKEQVSTACSACHSISQVTSQRRSQAEWKETVDDMIARGAKVADADYDKVVAYLGSNFSSATPVATAKP